MKTFFRIEIFQKGGKVCGWKDRLLNLKVTIGLLLLDVDAVLGLDTQELEKGHSRRMP